MSEQSKLDELFALFVQQDVVGETRPAIEELCSDYPDLIEPLTELIRKYDIVNETLTATTSQAERSLPPENEEPLPDFEGFRTIERLGSGGFGEVYKLEDLELGRLVAAKIVRSDKKIDRTVKAFLQEARTLALFEDPRIVRIIEFRSHTDPPAILMEFVDGFELGAIGTSLEYSQRARLVADVAGAMHHAHRLGIQHRDLKPANILVDAQLRPRILDFGLASHDPHAGHGAGTPSYMAPEQLEAHSPIDARTDVYALGVILYELLCGTLPFTGGTQTELVTAIRAGNPRLPVEIVAGIPEALQAVALKAMEVDPARRYESAREMELDLNRFLDGTPVSARPTLYKTVLHKRIKPHLDQVGEWLRNKLIYPHEAERLDRVYQSLQLRDDDWIVESRTLSVSQIALYLGAFLLACGSMLYFLAYLNDAVSGIGEPLVHLAFPFAALFAVGRILCRRGQKAAGIAFYLGAAALLPLLLVILLHESGFGSRGEHELFSSESVSNRQLQAACFLACLWAWWLAMKTSTVALSAYFASTLFLLNIFILADFGLRDVLERGRYDLLAFRLVPCLVVFASTAYLTDVRRKPWFARPLYFASVLLFVSVLELLALKGMAFEHLGISFDNVPLEGAPDPVLLETVTTMTISGVLIYFIGWMLNRLGTNEMKSSASVMFFISPFAILEPLAYLVAAGGYSPRFDWCYLSAALVITFASHFRQRKSFYFAGLINTGAAIWLITKHNEWLDRPSWAVVVVVVGSVVLFSGMAQDLRERRRRVS